MADVSANVHFAAEPMHSRAGFHDVNGGRNGAARAQQRTTGRALLMLTRYGRLGASSRQRFFLFKEPLKERGLVVREHHFLSDAYLSRIYRARRPKPLDVVRCYLGRLLALWSSSPDDVIWIEKEAFPWTPGFIERLLIGRRPIIVDFDDGWHLRYARRDASWPARLMAGKLEALARDANVVLVANRQLERWARKAGAQKVVLVPTVVDMQRYPVVDEPRGQFTIGWVGTPLNLTYLQRIVEPLRRLSEQGARLLLIGAGQTLDLPGVAVEAVPWDEATEWEQISRCHVGIMPLDGSPWDRYKSGYKIIQYMAAGRAVVASPVGANCEIIQHGVTGYLAGSDGEWLRALTGLRDDPALRKRFGAAGRNRCRDLYSREFALGQIMQALSGWPEFAEVLADRAALTAASAPAADLHLTD